MKIINYLRVLLVSLTVLTLCLFSSMNTALANDRDRAEKRKKQASQKIKETQASLEGINSKLAKLIVKIEENQAKQQDASTALAEAKVKLADSTRVQTEVADRLRITQTRLTEINTAVSDANRDIANSKAKIGQVARQLYTSQANFGAMNFVFGKATAADLAIYARNASLAVQIQKQSYDKVTEEIVQQRNSLAAQQELTEQVKQLKKEADEALAMANHIKDEREKNLKLLNNLIAQEKSYRSTLNGKKGDLQSELNRAQAQQRKAEAEIAKIDAANRRKSAANQGTSGGGTATAGFMGGSLFQAPIRGRLYMNSPFGWRYHPILGRQRFHAGVDIASACGNPQYAAANGTVVHAGRNSTGGINVTINHGIISGYSWITVYRHLSQVKTYSGQYVRKGQLIGITGTTGLSTGCHTHFELWKNGVAVNGWNYIYH